MFSSLAAKSTGSLVLCVLAPDPPSNPGKVVKSSVPQLQTHTAWKFCLQRVPFLPSFFAAWRMMLSTNGHSKACMHIYLPVKLKSFLISASLITH